MTATGVPPATSGTYTLFVDLPEGGNQEVWKISRTKRYWLSDRSVPFGTVLDYLEKYCSPEVRDVHYRLLVARARLSDPADTELMDFKSEIARVLRGDREGLHPREIITAAQYDDWHTDEEFLEWAWQDLFPNEPVPYRASGESSGAQ